MKRFCFVGNVMFDVYRGKKSDIKDVLFQLCLKGVVVEKKDYEKINKIIFLMKKGELEHSVGNFFIKNNCLLGNIRGVFCAPIVDVYDDGVVYSPDGSSAEILSVEDNYKISIIAGLYSLLAV